MHIDMVTNQAIDATMRVQQAKGFVGRTFTMAHDTVKDDQGKVQQGFTDMKPEALEKYGEGIRDRVLAKQPLPNFDIARGKAIQESRPDLASASLRTALKAHAIDMHAAADARRALDDGRYLEVVGPEGQSQRGVVSDKDTMKRHGPWISSDEEGRVRQVANFKEGKLDGATMELDEDGKLSQRGYYRDGLKNGTFTKYTDGKVTEQVKYQKDQEVERRDQAEIQRKAERRQEVRQSIAIGQAIKI